MIHIPKIWNTIVLVVVSFYIILPVLDSSPSFTNEVIVLQWLACHSEKDLPITFMLQMARCPSLSKINKSLLYWYMTFLISVHLVVNIDSQ